MKRIIESNLQQVLSKVDNLIMILDLNRPYETLECLSSLIKNGPETYTMLLLENGSSTINVRIIIDSLMIQKEELSKNGTDLFFMDEDAFISNSWEMTPEYTQKVWIIVVAKDNKGYAGGNNFLLSTFVRKCIPSTIFILNNDIIFENHCFDIIKEEMKTNGPSIIGPMVLEKNGKSIQSCGGSFNKRTGRIRLNNLGTNPETIQETTTMNCDFVSGCFMVLDFRIYEEIGLFFEPFFAYCEDLDLCLRAREHGYSIFCAMEGKIRHAESTTTGVFSHFKSFQQVRNQIWLMRMHSGLGLATLFGFYYLTLELPLLTLWKCLLAKDPYLIIVSIKAAKNGFLYRL